MADDDVKREDQIDQRVNDRLSNPSRELSEQENKGSTEASAGYGQTGSDNVAQEIGERESTPAGGWVDNTQPNPAPQKGTSDFVKSVLLKRVTPIAGVGGGVTGVFIIMSLLLTPSTLLVHVKEMLVNNHDRQNTSMEQRSRLMTGLKANGALKGVCAGPITLRCKYNRMSDKLLKDLKDAKIVATTTDDPSVIDKKFAKRPTEFKFTNARNEVITVKPADLSKTLSSNPEFRAAWRAAYNPRHVGFFDSVFRNIMTRFKFGKADILEGKDDAKTQDVQKALQDESKGEKVKSTGAAQDTTNKDGTPKDPSAETSGAASATDDAAAAADDIAKAGTSEAQTAAGKQLVSKFLSGGIKGGGAAGLVIGLVCMAQDLPKTMANVTRAAQMAQLIKYSMVFLTVADRIKSGDNPSPAEVAALGTIMTTVMKDKNGNITKQAGPDGAGGKYLLYGDIPKVPKDTDTSKWTKYVPGGGWASSLGGFASKLSAMKPFCDAAGSTAGSIAIGLLGGVTSLVSTLVLMGAAPAIESVLGPLVTRLGLTMAGNIVSSDAVGEDTMDLTASGGLNMLAETAAAGGNGTLSPESAVAYDGVARQVQLAYAEEERATLSPFDISSSNTFMGSIFAAMIPYTYNFSSATDVIHSFRSMMSATIPSFLGQASAADPTEQWRQCDIPQIKDSGIAAGPFCDVAYGVSPKYLNTDPNTVLDSLKGQFDEITGEPTSGGLKDYADNCTKGTSESLDKLPECRADNQKTAMYALFLIDKRVQKTMDSEGEVVGGNEKAAGPAAPSTTNNAVPDKNGWSLPLVSSKVTSLGWHQSDKGGRIHKGIDFPSPKGTPVIAAHDGTVTKIADMGSCGWATVIQVDGLSGIYMGYQHMDPSVAMNQHVKRGDQIGVIGTFCGTGYHVHFSIETANRVSAYADSGASDTSRNPADYLPL